ncbi:ABC transporter permease [Paraburkholderia sp. MM6662-R1]|uniref:ABC transporter permease n=1 Tax=Paraburkholderia sp. MM6662-R1 TaxID=2991066 RepID=UPI003D221A8F
MQNMKRVLEAPVNVNSLRMQNFKRVLDAPAGVIVGILIVVTAIFLIFPVIVTTLMAFDSRAYFGPFPPPGLSTQWFSKLLTSDYIINGFKTSVLIAVAATVISTVVGTMAALSIVEMQPGKRDLVTTLFLSPLVLPSVIIGFALLLVLSFTPIPAFWRILLGHLIITIPYTVRMTLIGLAGINPSLRDAALSLGANERQALFSVTLPLAKNGIAAGAIFAFAYSMDDVAISMFASDYNTFTLPIALVSLIRSSFDLTVAAAAVFLMVLTLVLLLILDRVIGLEKVMGQSLYRTEDK